MDSRADRHGRWLAIGAGLSACLLWAISNVIDKTLLDIGVTPLTLLAAQLLVSTPALWVIVLLAGRRPETRAIVRLMPIGILQPGLAYGLGLIGLAMTSATIEALLFSTETLFIIALVWPLLGERPGRLVMLAGIVGTVGVAMVSVGGDATEGIQKGLLGSIIILAGVLAAALGSIQLRREALKVDALSLIAACQTGGFLSAALAWSIWPDPDRFANLTFQTLPLIALSGIIMHALAFVLFAFQLQRMQASEAGLILLTTPIMTGVLAYFWLGDRVNPLQISGAVVVLFSILLIIRNEPHLSE